MPFDPNNNSGFVAFKIKTVPTIVNGIQITNSASIYFVYYQPVTTNISTTTIQTLQIQDYVFSDFFTIYPNPVADILNITNKKQLEINSITIYNSLGQQVKTFINANNTTSIDVSQLKTGLYFIKINSDKGSTTSKFIKELFQKKF